MSSFQRFGATVAAVVALVPGSIEADLGGSSAVGEALDHAARQIAASLPAGVWQALLWPTHELIVPSASPGQTTATLGAVPVRAGSLHLWRRPALAEADLGLEAPPALGVAEESGFSVDLPSGAISGLAALAAGERLYATYAVDASHASFAVPSLAALCARLALGDLLAHQATGTTNAATATTAQQQLAALASGAQTLAELRARRWWPQRSLGSVVAGSVAVGRG